jgi:hypothetical protein
VKTVEIHEDSATITITRTELLDILLSLKVNYDLLNGVKSPEISVVQSKKDIANLVKSLGPVTRELCRKSGLDYRDVFP